MLKRRLEEANDSEEREEAKRSLFVTSLYHARGYSHVARTATQHPEDVNRWDVSFGMSQLVKELKHTQAAMIARAVVRGTGHTLNFPWMSQLSGLNIDVPCELVNVIDLSAVAHTLTTFSLYDCSQDPTRISLRIVNLHKCKTLKLLSLYFQNTQQKPLVPNTSPLLDLRTSPRLTALKKLTSVVIMNRNPTRFPIELAASRDFKHAGIRTANYSSMPVMARQLHALFKLYTALMRACKKSSSNTAWHRLVLRGPLHDPSIVCRLAFRICPALMLPASMGWDGREYQR